MFARLSLISVLFLAACASQPSVEEQEAAAAKATDECLADSALAREWGECNVKRTIYARMAAIGECQRKFHKGSRPGDTLMLKIRVRPNGRVKDVRADENVRPVNKPLESCLSKEIGKLQFAAPPQGVKPIIYFPYQL